MALNTVAAVDYPQPDWWSGKETGSPVAARLLSPPSPRVRDIYIYMLTLLIELGIRIMDVLAVTSSAVLDLDLLTFATPPALC